MFLPCSELRRRFYLERKGDASRRTLLASLQPGVAVVHDGQTLAQVFKEGIAGAEVALVPGAVHARVLEQPQRTIEFVTQFLNRCEYPRFNFLDISPIDQVQGSLR